MNPLGLTDREVLVVWAWATGHNAAWLACRFGLNVHTVRWREDVVREKLKARNRTHAVAIVMRVILDASPPAPAAAPVSVERLARGARKAIREGADPLLVLSYVAWPPEGLLAA